MNDRYKKEFKDVVDNDPKNAGKWLTRHLEETGKNNDVEYITEMFKIYIGQE